MNVFYNSGGGCFLGECLVQIHNQGQKMVKDIKKGDKVIGD